MKHTHPTYTLPTTFLKAMHTYLRELQKWVILPRGKSLLLEDLLAGLDTVLSEEGPPAIRIDPLCRVCGKPITAEWHDFNYGEVIEDVLDTDTWSCRTTRRIDGGISGVHNA